MCLNRLLIVVPFNVRATSNKATREIAQQEAAYAKSLPSSFILTEPRTSLKSFQTAANAAKSPTQPMRPQMTLKKKNGNDHAQSAQTRKSSVPASPEEEANRLILHRRELPATSSVVKHIPMAKRSHMDGILHGIPRDKEAPKSTQQDHLEYTNEMQDMNRDKDTSFHRKRDSYSEYVEARARFSKMHSVS